MAKQRTVASRYQSRYTDSFVTAAQYITELVAEKSAKQSKIDLMREFWKLPEWHDYFVQQIRVANQLLKKYPAKAIIAALNHVKAARIYSLRAPHLLPLIDAEVKKIKLQEAALKKVEPPKVSEEATKIKPRPTLGNGGGIFKKLKEIDGEKES